MALGSLIIKARLGLTDEELVEQIKENPYLQFFTGLEAFQYSAPFDPSMMMYFRKRLPGAVLNDCNERIVHHSLSVIRASDSQNHGDDTGSGTGSGSGSSTGQQDRPLRSSRTRGYS
jgi:IS5 family transposase